MSTVIELADGKYTYVYEDGKQYALRYGHLWRDLIDDQFVYCMAAKITELQEQLATLEGTLHAQKDRASDIEKELVPTNPPLRIERGAAFRKWYCEDRIAHQQAELLKSVWVQAWNAAKEAAALEAEKEVTMEGYEKEISRAIRAL